MKTNRAKQKYDTQEHCAMKLEVAGILNALGFERIIREHRHCDIVCVKPGNNQVHCTEIERTDRNALRNLSRNFSNGCGTCLVVCPDFASVQEVARKIARGLPAELRERTGIVTISALRQLSG
jgi:hypothetical protein